MRILTYLRELNDALTDWEKYQKISIEELRADRDKRNMVLHAMLVSIQASIDIATYIIAQRGLEKPSTYRETFEILGRQGLISKELADELSDLAGFRNVLVHIYWGLNLDEVYGVLQNDLRVLKEYITYVKKLLPEES
ncbi:hypothetical protein ANME2D_00168 [Candidatus Methanoperedens nitroreducens]|uniref:DUF86 domain-containing protein n=1 Tax=Candidatus Methanoperedens nitratireducens TaxID=1392998 RepID=A0A062VBN4_9EURY|nr:DUF86 domain-containing protein [Candidatus Methanoperedens nitroreducens]KCZ73109.1 hypothetical protein ANME2D_00168 [Candidatus Methanoperedens nitroreducens]MDJ1422945.1 DUF86 domain-containing protein [Candidatus Methanoperedens sp.]